MQLVQFPQSGPLYAFQTIQKDDRARVSGPSLRTFRNIADEWSLSERDRIAILGEPGRSTYHLWMKKAGEGAALSLPLDTLLRLSGVLGIYKSLAILFSDPAQGHVWLQNPHQGTVFNGASPLSFVIDGGQDGILTVRRYLDAWRGGHMGHGAEDFEPVGEDDVVFV
ncbi:DUF2384 domain-containing protein [Marivivens donghaensis]|uniref:DUF2384 domain-containing protein n=1 Tax=Marivivens donghaensis TaxID=1699413 RepID=A0ABX0VXC9_9RHOB|nr:MbcA/ParS/Xre antitoxin family protein [Marivivens donghaensis]NIY72725.1 DUF2384 domain-containing protein [Marivivens donghaensis]